MNAALRQTLSPARKICGSLSVRIAGEAGPQGGGE